MVVDLNSTNILGVVMKLLHFATDSVIKLVASGTMYERWSSIDKLCHWQTSILKSEFDHADFAVAARNEKMYLLDCVITVYTRAGVSVYLHLLLWS
jgi:hypothetical protein